MVVMMQKANFSGSLAPHFYHMTYSSTYSSKKSIIEGLSMITALSMMNLDRPDA